MKRNRRPTLGYIRSDTGEAVAIKHHTLAQKLADDEAAIASLAERAHVAEAACASRGLELSKLNLCWWTRLGRRLGALPKS